MFVLELWSMWFRLPACWQFAIDHNSTTCAYVAMYVLCSCLDCVEDKCVNARGSIGRAIGRAAKSDGMLNPSLLPFILIFSNHKRFY